MRPRRQPSGAVLTIVARHRHVPLERTCYASHSNGRLATAAIGCPAGSSRTVPAPVGRRADRSVPRWPRWRSPARRPAQPSSRVSSPLRNRWQRTPPVARPLPGILGERGDLDRTGVGAGQGRRRPGDGDHAAVVGAAPKKTARAPGPSLIPAIPPPERPCGRTTDGREVQELGVAADEDQFGLGRGQLHRADDLVARVEPDHLPGVATEHLGIDPLDDTVRRAQGQPERVGGQRW